MPGMGLLELCHRRLQLRVGLREHRYHLQEQFALLVLPSLEQLTLFSLLAHYLLELLPLLLLLTQHLLQLLLVESYVALVLELLHHILFLPQFVLYPAVHQHPPRVKAKDHRDGATPLIHEVGQRTPPHTRRQVTTGRHTPRPKRACERAPSNRRFEGAGSCHDRRAARSYA